MSPDPERRAHARQAAAATAQYSLLFGFAAVAAGISAQGLTGFARSSMGLRGPWPYLLWGALDGAAGLCAVLLMRRAARGEGALAPRLAVWGLVAASSTFNWAHAPDHPAARQAFALMPVIAAVLFEFSLRETRRHAAGPAGRRLPGLRWLHPGERIRVQLQLAADETMAAGEATRRVRTEYAARCLYTLCQVLEMSERRPRTARLRARQAERRAQAALTRAGFADAAMAADILRQVQVLALTRTLARLDYSSPDDARDVMASLITQDPARRQQAGLGGVRRLTGRPADGRAVNGHQAEPHGAMPAVAAPAVRSDGAGEGDGGRVGDPGGAAAGVGAHVIPQL